MSWVASWTAAMEPNIHGRPDDRRSFANHTLRQVVTLSRGGAALRLHVSNQFGSRPLPLLGARVACAAGGSGIGPGTDRAVTFAGQPGTEIAPGESAVSDPVAWPVIARQTLAVDLLVGWDGASPSVNHQALQTGHLLKGDQLGRRTLFGAFTMHQRVFLTGVDVQADGGATLVAFGDSITLGQQSSVEANQRYPDLLAERLLATPALCHVGVANRGISGNRLLCDRSGPSGASRFARDVLATPGVRAAIVLIGVNDIWLPFSNEVFGPKVAAAELIAGYRALIAAAHAAGVRVMGGTILPFGAIANWTEAGEAVRAEVNAWTRDGGGWDAVADFDAALRDRADPRRIAPELVAPGGLHPSDAGYAALAASVDLDTLARLLG